MTKNTLHNYYTYIVGTIGAVFIFASAVALINTTPAYACSFPPPLTNPVPVTNLRATYITPTGNAFNVTWQWYTGVREYEVQVKGSKNGAWHNAVSIKTPEPRVNIIVPPRHNNVPYLFSPYFFRVRMTIRNGEIGPWSDVVEGYVQSSDKQNWKINWLRAIPLSDTSVHLLWSPLRYDTPYYTPGKDTSPFPKGYEVEYKEEGKDWRPVSVEGYKHISVFTNLKPDTEYSFRARFDLTPAKSAGSYYGPWKTTSTRTLSSGESRDPDLTDTDLRSPISMCSNIGRTAVWVLDGAGDDGLWEGGGLRIGVYWEPSVWATEYEVEYTHLKTNKVTVSTYKNDVFTTSGLDPGEPLSIRIRNKNATRTSGWSQSTVVALAPVPSTNEIQHIQDGDLIRLTADQTPVSYTHLTLPTNREV